MNKRFKKFAFQAHLWLGGISGIVVFVVCITGAIWAIGIHNWLGTNEQPTKIEAEGKSFLAPSVILEQLKNSHHIESPNSISYTPNEESTIRVYNDSTSLMLKVNPYTADVTELKDYNSSEYEMSFWDYMRWGHRALWLPWDTGRMIVNYGTLLFLIVLISGLILWVPKSRKGLKNRLTLNWTKTTKAKRKFYDLHLVLGFYASFLLIIICATGMVWGLSWWSEATYKVTTGKSLPPWGAIKSTPDPNAIIATASQADKLDILFYQTIENNPQMESFSISISQADTTPFEVRVNNDRSVLYNYDTYNYNYDSLDLIEAQGYNTGKYEDKSFGEKLRRQNYDLHIGRIWGPVGEVLIFFAALFGASLPLTGYYILFVVKRRGRKKTK